MIHYDEWRHNVQWPFTICVSLTWFPDAGFREKLTKLSVLKLSERQKHKTICIQSLHLSPRINTSVHARPQHETNIYNQHITIHYNTILIVKSFVSFCCHISFIWNSIYEQCHLITSLVSAGQLSDSFSHVALDLLWHIKRLVGIRNVKQGCFFVLCCVIEEVRVSGGKIQVSCTRKENLGVNVESQGMVRDPESLTSQIQGVSEPLSLIWYKSLKYCSWLVPVGEHVLTLRCWERRCLRERGTPCSHSTWQLQISSRVWSSLENRWRFWFCLDSHRTWKGKDCGLV